MKERKKNIKKRRNVKCGETYDYYVQSVERTRKGEEKKTVILLINNEQPRQKNC